MIILPDFSDIPEISGIVGILYDQHRFLFLGNGEDMLLVQEPIDKLFLD